MDTDNFNKAVARNLDRFPADFAFVLTKEEFGWTGGGACGGKPMNNGQ